MNKESEELYKIIEIKIGYFARQDYKTNDLTEIIDSYKHIAGDKIRCQGEFATFVGGKEKNNLTSEDALEIAKSLCGYETSNLDDDDSYRHELKQGEK